MDRYNFPFQHFLRSFIVVYPIRIEEQDTPNIGEFFSGLIMSLGVPPSNVSFEGLQFSSATVSAAFDGKGPQAQNTTYIIEAFEVLSPSREQPSLYHEI